MNLAALFPARELLDRFGLGAYSFALEAALQARKSGEVDEAAAWFDIADAVEMLIVGSTDPREGQE